MIIDNLNLNLLRVFESVYRSKSMTQAAGELHMTQSGVSQNIKNLEDILDFKLFDRVKQKPVPTEKATILYEKVSVYLNDIEDTLASLKGVDRTLKGKVRIGLPIEYGNNMILPLLAKWGHKHRSITYKINYGHASEMNRMLLDGALDFAIVDNYTLDKQVHAIKVADEVLLMVASKEYVKDKGPLKTDRKFFESLDYIDYVEDTPILRQWFKHHFKMQNLELDVRASLMDVQGMGRMIVHDLGVGILPQHVVRKLREQGFNLHIFSGSGKELHNPISIAYLKGRTLSPAVEQTMNFVVDSLKIN